jgi:hypothetical protein
MKLLALLLVAVLPTSALAQSDVPPPLVSPPPPLVSPPPSYPEPPPPSYPPVAPVPSQAPQPPPNLQPYAPLSPRPPAAAGSQHELGLAGAEFFASAGVTLAATLAVASALGSQSTSSGQATAQIVSLLYLGLIPAVSSLPVWLIGLISDSYEPRIGPAIEAGSTVSGIAFIIFFIADQTQAPGTGTSPWKYAAGGLLLVGMPLAEVLAMNLTKSPKGGVPYYGAPVLPEAPPAFASPGLPSASTVCIALPAIRF